MTTSAANAWDRLASRAVEPNPFFERRFVTAAATNLGGGDVEVLFIRSGNEWIGCMPVRMTRVLNLHLLVSNWKHSYSFLGTPLVDRDRIGEFSSSLMRSTAAREHGRFLALRTMSAGSVLDSILSAAAEIGPVDVLFKRASERAALERRPSADYDSGMKSKRRSELKRLRRRLGETLGAEIASRDRDDIGEAVEAFLRLEASGWKGRDGTAMASNHGSAEFFRTICTELGQEGRLRIRSLEAGDRVLAMTVDLRAGNSLFGFKTAFDEEFSRSSPGIHLQIDNFTAFHEHDSEQFIDSCSEPGNETMNALWPDRRSIVTLMLGRRSLVNPVIEQTIGAAYKARRQRA